MRSRLQSRGETLVCCLAVIAVIALLIGSSSSYASTTTPLLSESFSSSSNFNNWSGYKSSFDGWYWSSAGKSGSNGSIVMNTYYGRDASITSQAFDGSAFVTQGDSMFLDLDLFMPKNYYDVYYGSSNSLIVLINGTQITKLDKSSNATVTISTYSYTSTPLTTTSYWRHLHIYIPTDQRSANMSITFEGTASNSSYYYPYSNNLAIDNISVVNTRYTGATVSKKSLEFGNLAKGLTSAPQFIVVGNPNAQVMNLSNLRIVGSNPGDFQIVSAPTSLAPGTVSNPTLDSIGVVFTPQVKNYRQATLAFSLDVDNPSSVTVSLSGFGLVSLISLPNGNVAFRKEYTHFDGSATTMVPIVNTGLIPLVVDTLMTYLEGDAPEQYQLTYEPVQPIAPGATDSIVIRFTPRDEGLQNATLVLNSNADNGEQRVQLKAVGVVPHLVLEPARVVFDTTDVGVETSRTVRLTNTGTDKLAITANYLTGSDLDYRIVGISGTDSLLAPSESRDIQVYFKPLRSGTRTGRIRLTTNIPLTFEDPRRDTSAFTVDLYAMARSVGALEARTAAMDSVIVGMQACHVDSVVNVGTESVRLLSVQIGGLDAGDFQLSNLSFPITLAPGASLPVSICATPSVRGERNASLTFNGVSNGRTVSLSVPQHVLAQEVCASAQLAAALPSRTTVSMTDTAVVRVTNCGDVQSMYTAELGSASSGFVLLDGSSVSSVPAGGTATFRVAFAPTARGTATTDLTITGGAGVQPMTVELSGNGAAAVISGTAVAPATRVGDVSAPFEVTIQNTGDIDYTPGMPAVTGPFTYVSGGTSAIAPGASSTMTFTFAPTSSGTFNSTLTFPNAIGVASPTPDVTISGSTTTADVSLAEQKGIRLLQNYPNPAWNSTTITFEAPNDAFVTVELVDAQGRSLQTLFSGRAHAGSNAISVATESLASGTYYYRLTSGDVQQTRQMQLVK